MGWGFRAPVTKCSVWADGASSRSVGGLWACTAGLSVCVEHGLGSRSVTTVLSLETKSRSFRSCDILDMLSINGLTIEICFIKSHYSVLKHDCCITSEAT